MKCEKKGCNKEITQGEKELSISRSCYCLCEKHEEEMLEVQMNFINAVKHEEVKEE